METRKILSKAAALCLALIMAACIPAAAASAAGQDEKGTILINGVEDSVDVSAYRMMEVTVNENGQPQDPVYRWTSGLAEWVRGQYPAYIGTGADNSVQPAFHSGAGADVLSEFYGSLAAAVRDGTAGLSAEKTVKASGNMASFTEMPMGSYLILIENGGKVYSPVAVNLAPVWNAEAEPPAWELPETVRAEAKSGEADIIKTVRAPGTADGRKADNAGIGDLLIYEIAADVPQFPSGSGGAGYAVSDSLPAGITFQEDTIMVYGINGDKETLLDNSGNSFYTQTAARPGNGGASDFTLTFDYERISSYERIRVEYRAVLNGDAVLGDSGNVNTASLDYSNNPSAGWQTRTDSAAVYTYGLDISKVDKDGGGFLPGAEFCLYASQDDITAGKAIPFVRVSEGVYRRASAGDGQTTDRLTVGSGGNLTGRLTLKGLDEGTWYLEETKAPKGYNLLDSPVEVTVEDAAGSVPGGRVQNAEGSSGEAAARVSLTVVNDDGFRPPVTGGMGTVLFTAAGAALMGSAAVMVAAAVRKRKL